METIELMTPSVTVEIAYVSNHSVKCYCTHPAFLFCANSDVTQVQCGDGSHFIFHLRFGRQQAVSISSVT